MTKMTEAEEAIEAIKVSRLALGVTQKALSEKAGLNGNYVCRLEGGEFDNPSFSKVSAINKALACFELAASEAAE